MSDIPRARKRLRTVAKELRRLKEKKLAAELESIIDDDLYRRKPARKMRRKSVPVTASVKAKIIQLAETDLHSDEIAARVGVNPGRVSEVLQGDR